MSIAPKHLRALISDVLKAIDLHSPEAVELLMMTAAQESHCGKYLTQIKGPARGIFQMEPATLADLHEHFLRYRPALQAKIDMMCSGICASNWDVHMRGNLIYQIVIARLQYLRFPDRIPTNLDSMAHYYKKYWNTALGKATVEEAMANYKLYAN